MIVRKVIFAFTISLLVNGCSNLSQDIDDSKNTSTNSAVVVTSSSELPTRFSLDSIRKAFKEYINYRLWFYPDETEKQFNFEPYIGKEITTEVRVYESNPQNIYIHTEIGDWLAKIVYANGFVYCDGFIRQEDTNIYPKGDYKKVDTLKIKVEPPHKPNYGTSHRKDKMIQAAVDYAEHLCKDFENGTESELWKDSKVYIVDFYEYENVINVWFVRQDGFASYTPVQVTESNNEFTTQGIKGFDIPNIRKLDKKDNETYFFEKQIGDTIKSYCPGNT
ncbi:hypothetical protein [Paenibacillus hexagrammi]|uniref:Lipoprotein n=1 Tax=Paenibacillus hexagrammi TaxID=2908839 RepID=A0ABY3SEA3_9BACL|nr:hypothetical protein [Paenibacillus sp. YPD9-1]UJF31800.1 hypothetical protein L0M14_18755 [Paenibacillus sp. YPD9-1]